MLNVIRGRTADEAILQLSGEVDLAVAPGMLERLLSGTLFDARRVVVDLDEVTFLDSSGLGLLAALRKPALRDPDGEFALINPHGIVAKVLQVASMDDLVEGGLPADVAGGQGEQTEE